MPAKASVDNLKWMMPSIRQIMMMPCRGAILIDKHSGQQHDWLTGATMIPAKAAIHVVVGKQEREMLRQRFFILTA